MKRKNLTFYICIILIFCYSCTKISTTDNEAPFPSSDGKVNSEITIDKINSITLSGAVVMGTNLYKIENNSVIGVCWSATNPVPSVTDNVILSVPVIGSFSLKLNKLPFSTTIYVRSFYDSNRVTILQNAYLKYGNVINFKTLDLQFDTVNICEQIWMKKNLDVSSYRNGDPIPQVTDATAWAELTTGAWCYYNNDPSTEAVYGKLYNWYAVNDPRGLAPLGWHLPSQSEWNDLSLCLGCHSGGAGGALKEAGTSHWLSPNTGATNSSGFTGLPGGSRNANFGAFGTLGGVGNWWSSTMINATTSSSYSLFFAEDTFGEFPALLNGGMSVRCVLDN